MFNFFDLWVAKRYLFPKTKDGFFSIITTFSFLGISLGVATLIIVMSVMNGFREELTSKVLGVNGHMKVKLYNNAYIIKYKELIKSLNNTEPEIKQHATLTSQGLLTYRNNSSGVIIKGISYEDLKERKLLSNAISNEALIDFKKRQGIIIGKRLKEQLNIDESSFIKIISSKSFETPFGKLIRSADYKVSGFFETGMYEYDLSLVLVPLETLQDFLGINERIDTLELFVPNFDEIDKFYNSLRNELPDYLNLIDWRSLNPSLFNAIKVERNVMFLILLLIILVAAFNLISSMIMLVNNKKKDIGVLRTLGVTRFQLLKIFVLNGFSIGFIGTILGFFLGIIFCLNINEIKTFIELFTDSELFAEEIYFFSNLPVIIDFREIVIIVLISLSLSFLATIYPSFMASKIDPINLIKWE